jgi:hypothetical protein
MDPAIHFKQMELQVRTVMVEIHLLLVRVRPFLTMDLETGVWRIARQMITMEMLFIEERRDQAF